MGNRKLLNSELGRPSLEEYRQMPKLPIVVVLDNVRSQFNIGAAFRSSDAFGVESVVLCGICAVPPSAEIHKSALGAELSVPWSYFNTTRDAVSHLKAEGFTIVSVEQAEKSISLENFVNEVFAKEYERIAEENGHAAEEDESTADSVPMRKVALVFGNEVFGVEQEVVDESDYVVEIPQTGTKHSINVSVSVGVVLWELFRTSGQLNKSRTFGPA